MFIETFRNDAIVTTLTAVDSAAVRKYQVYIIHGASCIVETRDSKSK